MYGTLLSKYPDATLLTIVLLKWGSPGIVRLDDDVPIPVTMISDGIALDPLMNQLRPTRVSLTEQRYGANWPASMGALRFAVNLTSAVAPKVRDIIIGHATLTIHLPPEV